MWQNFGAIKNLAWLTEVNFISISGPMSCVALFENSE